MHTWQLAHTHSRVTPLPASLSRRGAGPTAHYQSWPSETSLLLILCWVLREVPGVCCVCACLCYPQGHVVEDVAEGPGEPTEPGSGSSSNTAVRRSYPPQRPRPGTACCCSAEQVHNTSLIERTEGRCREPGGRGGGWLCLGVCRCAMQHRVQPLNECDCGLQEVGTGSSPLLWGGYVGDVRCAAVSRGPFALVYTALAAGRRVLQGSASG